MTHSFPTRRSSDLPQWAHRARASGITGRRCGHGNRESGVRRGQRTGSRPFGQTAVEVVRPAGRTDDLLVPYGAVGDEGDQVLVPRSEEHTSELQSLMRISYAVFCLKKKNKN